MQTETETQTQTLKSTLDKNKDILNRHIDVINNKDLSKLDEIIAADCINNGFPPDMPKGAEGQKMFLNMMITAFPDLYIEVNKETEIAEGDMVSHFVTISGTNQGTLMGMPATNKKISWGATHFAKVVDGKIKEFWLMSDRLGMMEQLGAIPTPTMPKK